MRYTIGNYEFDVISHERIVADGFVRERFTVALYVNGQAHPWHPGDSDSNVEVHEWVGREVVDVYEMQDGKPVKVGTKRGADFRARFWPSLLYWADKAVTASKAKKRIGEVRDAEMTRTALQREPVDLKSRSLDAAAAELTRTAVRQR